MKVFISWSGEKSRCIGEAFRQWLPNVHQQIEPFFSPSDIEKGARWTTEIETQLQDTRFCVVCLTPEALVSPWINFESGAISKGIGRNRVAPILFNLSKMDVSGPLSLFQLTDFVQSDVKEIVKAINNSFEEGQIRDDLLERAFDRWWPDLEKAIDSINLKVPQKISAAKSPEEVIEEILGNTREIMRQLSRSERSQERAAFPTLVSLNNAVTKTNTLVQSEELSEMIPLLRRISRKVLDLNELLGKRSGGSLQKLKGSFFKLEQEIDSETKSDPSLGDILGAALKRAKEQATIESTREIDDDSSSP